MVGSLSTTLYAHGEYRTTDRARRACQEDSHCISRASIALRGLLGHSFILPQLDAAEQTVSIADDLDVRRQFEVDRRRIAAADIQPVVVEGLRKLANHLAQVLVPLLL